MRKMPNAWFERAESWLGVSGVLTCSWGLGLFLWYFLNNDDMQGVKIGVLSGGEFNETIDFCIGIKFNKII